MRQIYYYEYYPHYTGTTTATVRFTPGQFNTLIEMAKAAIKEDDDTEGGEDIAREILDDHIEEIADKAGVYIYALDEALLDYFNTPRRPSNIVAALKRKGLWADQWEEGSFAFATTEKKAIKAVQAIEVTHMEDEWGY